MNKRLCAVCLMLLSLISVTVFAHQDIDQYRSCTHCGMDRKQFGYSRMLIAYEDGTQIGICSLHCAVTELNGHKGKKAKNILVADRDSHQLIDADKAIWVLGGRKRGVMTTRAKWAFSTQKTAQKFVEEFGGTIADWEKALAAAKEDAQPKSR